MNDLSLYTKYISLRVSSDIYILENMPKLITDMSHHTTEYKLTMLSEDTFHNDRILRLCAIC